jgi:hypothetical protein
MTTNTGGPAYPTSNYGAIVPMSTGYSEGMTLRDYFAAKAMQSILVGIECGPDDVASVVASAYIIADAMLKAREA